MKLSEYYNNSVNETQTSSQTQGSSQAQTSSQTSQPSNGYGRAVPTRTQDIAIVDPRTEEGKLLQQKLLQTLDADMPRIEQISRNNPPPLEINGRRLVPRGAMDVRDEALKAAVTPSKLMSDAAAHVPYAMDVKSLDTTWSYPDIELEKLNAEYDRRLENIREELSLRAEMAKDKYDHESDMAKGSGLDQAGRAVSTVGGIARGVGYMYDAGKGAVNTVSDWFNGDDYNYNTHFEDDDLGFEGYSQPGDYDYDPFNDDGYWL